MLFSEEYKMYIQQSIKSRHTHKHNISQKWKIFCSIT